MDSSSSASQPFRSLSNFFSSGSTTGANAQTVKDVVTNATDIFKKASTELKSELETIAKGDSQKIAVKVGIIAFGAILLYVNSTAILAGAVAGALLKDRINPGINSIKQQPHIVKIAGAVASIIGLYTFPSALFSVGSAASVAQGLEWMGL